MLLALQTISYKGISKKKSITKIHLVHKVSWLLHMLSFSSSFGMMISKVWHLGNSRKLLENLLKQYANKDKLNNII
jgi:hypothetical protein